MRYLKGVVAKKIPISAAGSMVEDHIQECFSNLIRRNALAKELSLKNEDIENSKLALYVMRSSWNDIRNGGQNPVMREFYFFRTESEKTKAPKAKVDGDITTVERTSGMEIIKHSLDETETDNLWERIRTILKGLYPESWVKFYEVLQKRAEGFSLKEIASSVSLSIKQINTFLATIQDPIRAVVKGQSEAVWRIVQLPTHKVLRIIEQYPSWYWSCERCASSARGERNITQLFGFVGVTNEKGVLVKEVPNKYCKGCV
jgi:hypothetical protein